MDKFTSKSVNLAIICVSVLIAIYILSSIFSNTSTQDELATQNKELIEAIRIMKSQKPVYYKIYEPKDSVHNTKGEYSYWFVFDKDNGSYGVRLKGQHFNEEKTLLMIDKKRKTTRIGTGISFFKRITLGEFEKCSGTVKE